MNIDIHDHGSDSGESDEENEPQTQQPQHRFAMGSMGVLHPSHQGHNVNVGHPNLGPQHHSNVVHGHMSINGMNVPIGQLGHQGQMMSHSQHHPQLSMGVPMGVPMNAGMNLSLHHGQQLHHAQLAQLSHLAPPGMMGNNAMSMYHHLQQQHHHHQQQLHLHQQQLSQQQAQQNISQQQQQQQQQQIQMSQQPLISSNSGHPVINYTGRAFPSERELRVWIAEEFGGMVNIHGKKFWRSGENIAKYKSWTCSCKHEKKSNCKFKLYIAWTNKSAGPVIKTSNAVHDGHPLDSALIGAKRSDSSYPSLENNYQQRDAGITEETYAKIINAMQNRENQCKRRLAQIYCSGAFEKFLARELELTTPAVVRRKVNEFIAANSTPEPSAY